MTSLVKDFAEERQMSKALQSNQSSWQTKYTALETKYEHYKNEKDCEILELKEEIRDLMFYMEAQNTIAKSDLKEEIASSSVTVPNNPPEANKLKNRRKKK